ncbi:hypothetical protein FN976_07885 [Caenimonas sedimenti]|uniref:Uncharacterized protein n=1 Tax=Caenimonas sedimenti TaxID=2596921 RepID=A0A562ZTG8_9BURK|nr:hypothetical protein [Caenimonas sedimenti]TWO71902.1 hypothetical protein FN976_07885 [Caenimonas sedimenti]
MKRGKDWQAGASRLERVAPANELQAFVNAGAARELKRWAAAALDEGFQSWLYWCVYISPNAAIGEIEPRAEGSP